MQTRIGIGVIVVNDQHQVLLGKRISQHGYNTWAFPGGHLEYLESPFECAMRETLEEAGIHIDALQQGPWTNDVFDDGKHYLTLFILAKHLSGTPALREPDKCEEWRWFEWEQLPQPLFKTIETMRATWPHFNPASIIL